MIVGSEQVRVLVEHARSPRDRALVLVNFQGGLDASTLCSIKYGDIAEGLAKNEHPLKLELQRPKTGTDFYTFLGHDAIEALKAYIADMKQRGVTFTHSTPLFLQGKSKEAMLTTAFPDEQNVNNLLRSEKEKILQLNRGFQNAKAAYDTITNLISKTDYLSLKDVSKMIAFIKKGMKLLNIDIKTTESW